MAAPRLPLRAVGDQIRAALRGTQRGRLITEQACPSPERLSEKAAAGLKAATAFFSLRAQVAATTAAWREGNGQRARRRHQLGDAPVCAIHRLDVRGRAAEARLLEISPVETSHPPRHRSTGQSYGRCGPIFDWSVPYGDLSIRPHVHLSYRGEKCFA